jgi:hypothetical protein
MIGFDLFGPDLCRACGNWEVQPSRPSLVRSVARLVGLRRFRCLHCGKTFWRFRVRPPVPAKRVRRPPGPAGPGVSQDTPMPERAGGGPPPVAPPPVTPPR